VPQPRVVSQQSRSEVVLGDLDLGALRRALSPAKKGGKKKKRACKAGMTIRAPKKPAKSK
jgi:hypothetical protein